jgi:hypothetical protein
MTSQKPVMLTSEGRECPLNLRHVMYTRAIAIMTTALCGPWPFFSLFKLRAPWMGDQYVPRPLSTHYTTQTEQTPTPWEASSCFRLWQALYQGTLQLIINCYGKIHKTSEHNSLRQMHAFHLPHWISVPLCTSCSVQTLRTSGPQIRQTTYFVSSVGRR